MRKEAAQEWRINMRNRFDRQLVQLNNELIEMGGMIEKAISDTVKALVNQDIELASNVIEYDEEIDHQEREIEQLCLKLLLQQQPVAKDLRLISAALKMITDMERIGDHATDISEITIELSKESIEEANNLLFDIKYYIKPDGTLMNNPSIPPADLLMKHLTTTLDTNTIIMQANDLIGVFTKEELIKKLNKISNNNFTTLNNNIYVLLNDKMDV
jgi:phosphate transport system protein